MRDGELIVAQIGCGKFAEYQDLPNIAVLPQVKLKWLCDIDLERAGKLKQQYGAEKITSDFKDICADPEVDLIKIATSHEIHLPIIECAAAAGKHIFCEKPMENHQNCTETWSEIVCRFEPSHVAGTSGVEKKRLRSSGCSVPFPMALYRNQTETAG